MSNEVVICLSALDGGKALDLIDSALLEVSADVVARPNLTKARTVTVKIAIVPVPDPEFQEINTPEIDVKVSTALPGVGRTARAIVRNGKLYLNAPFSDPRQQQMDYRDAETEVEDDDGDDGDSESNVVRMGGGGDRT